MDFNMANEIALNWQSEDIPDNDFLYMRVHKNWFQPKQNIVGLFKNHGEGMSTDWSKYATPLETRERVVQFGKTPENFAVIKMLVTNVREIENQIVKHTPDEPNRNRAHTDILGEKDAEIRLKFSRIFEIVIKIEDSV